MFKRNLRKKDKVNSFKLFGVAMLAESFKTLSTKSLCAIYSSFRVDGQLSALEYKRTLLQELKSRDKEAFYLFVYDGTNFHDPGVYFCRGDK